MHEGIYFNIIYGNEEKEMTEHSEEEFKSNPFWYIHLRKPYTEANYWCKPVLPDFASLPTILFRGKVGD